jgi:hypothetical protein
MLLTLVSDDKEFVFEDSAKIRVTNDLSKPGFILQVPFLIFALDFT